MCSRFDVRIGYVNVNIAEVVVMNVKVVIDGLVLASAAPSSCPLFP